MKFPKIKLKSFYYISHHIYFVEILYYNYFSTLLQCYIVISYVTKRDTSEIITVSAGYNNSYNTSINSNSGQSYYCCSMH